jgi:predicted nucleic acid-binding protein
LVKLPQAFVVDASVSAAWLLPDEADQITEAALQATATHDVWVPALWWLEVGNLLQSAQRRKRIDTASGANWLSQLRRCGSKSIESRWAC